MKFHLKRNNQERYLFEENGKRHMFVRGIGGGERHNRQHFREEAREIYRRLLAAGFKPYEPADPEDEEFVLSVLVHGN